MLSDKYIPTRLISPSERVQIPLVSPRKPSWLRPVLVFITLFWQFMLFLWYMVIHKSHRAEYGRQAVHFLRRSGAVWIKAGQLLSLRSDLLSTDVCRELASLQDLGNGVPFESVRQILEEELQCSLTSLFDHFDEQPFLATSVAQLHRAYLRPEKAWVVVKVQKPFAKQLFMQDMAIIRKIPWLLNALSVYPNMRWGDLHKQLNELMTKELDFRYEVSSLRRLKKKLKSHKVYVPKTFRSYCTRRVLVMEFIHGVLMTDFIAVQQADPSRLQTWLQENDIHPRRVARRLFRSVYRQIFEDNVFHGDMHPGNVVLLRYDRLAILDCRSIGSLEGELLTKYRLFLDAFAHKRYGNATDVYFLAASSLPVVDTARVKAELTRLWRVWEAKTHIREFDYQEKSLGGIFDDMNKLMFTYQFTIQWSLSKLVRALVNLDASLRYLAPSINYPREMRRYFAHAEKRTAAAQLRRSPKRIPRSIIASHSLPGQAAEYKLFQQSVLRRQAQVVQGKTTKTGYVIASLLGCLSIILLFVEGLAGCAFLHQVFRYPVQHITGNQLFTVIRLMPDISWMVWLLILVGIAPLFISVRRLKVQFEQVDVLLPDAQPAV